MSGLAVPPLPRSQGSCTTMSGPAEEPAAELAAEQMRDATERLRGKGWMVAPLTSSEAAVVIPALDDEGVSP